MEPNLHTDANKYQAGMGGWSKTLAPLFIEFIGDIREGDRVLDVGCGTGSLSIAVELRLRYQNRSIYLCCNRVLLIVNSVGRDVSSVLVRSERRVFR
jgi:predicted RNA methylase